MGGNLPTIITAVFLTAEVPYTVAILVSAVAALFAALGKMALILLQRTDRAHEAEKQTIVAAYTERLVEKDEECERERERAKIYEQYTLRLLEAARAATSVATDAIAKRVES
jgi:hypothetical protein